MQRLGMMIVMAGCRGRLQRVQLQGTKAVDKGTL